MGFCLNSFVVEKTYHWTKSARDTHTANTVNLSY